MSSIRTKVDYVISKLKKQILIPSFIVNISTDWLMERLKNKGYSKVKRTGEVIKCKGIAISISQLNTEKYEIKTKKTMKTITKVLLSVFYIILVLVIIKDFYHLKVDWYDIETMYDYKMYEMCNYLYFKLFWVPSLSWISEYLYLPEGYCYLVPNAFILLISVSLSVIPYFKRKKKLIRDISEICLEECER